MANSFSLSALAIRRHIGTLMLTLAVMVMGIFFLGRLPVDLLPSITYPRIGVRADAPGLAPEVALESVTRPLEQALAATEGVVQVVSTTREGRISLDLYFRPGGNIDQALNDATATLNRARGSLPDTVGQPRLFKFDPSQLPVYEMALTSPSLPGRALRVFAEEELVRALGSVDGVASVEVTGGAREEIQVNLDPVRLQRVGLGVNTVITALANENQDTGGGRVLGEAEEPLVRVVGRFQSAQEIRDLPLALAVGGPQVRLRDVAEVVDGTEDQRVAVSLNGEPAVKVSVQKQAEANTIAVVTGIKGRLEELADQGALPPDLVLNVTLDESVFIQNAIRNVMSAGISGAVLAAIAVLLFLGSLRQTVIIVVAIPLAVLVAIVLMGAFGLSLNVFSLGGLALGVGIVVDNAIVMLENLAKGAEERPLLAVGPQERAAAFTEVAIAQSQALESALVASTVTNLAAVVPFLLLGGFIALLFNELVLTISFAVAASLGVALTVVPALATRLLVRPGSSGLRQWTPIRWIDQRLKGMTRHYGRTLAWVLGRAGWVVAIAVVTLGLGSALMLGAIPQEILPRISTGQATLRVQFPPGTTLAENQRVMAAVDEIILAQPETTGAFTTAGGNLSGTNISENPLRGSSTISLQPGTDVAAYSDRLTAALNELNLVQTRIRVSPGAVRGIILNNAPVRGDVDIVLEGADDRRLAEAERSVMAALREQATLANFLPNSEAPQPEIQIRPDRERVAALGLSSREVGAMVQTVLGGTVATQVQRGERLVDVRLRVPPGQVTDVSSLGRVPLLGPGGRPLRLGDVARIEMGTAPGEIRRIDQRQVAIMEGSLADGASLGAALAEVDRILAAVPLPEGVRRLPSYSARSNAEIQGAVVNLGLLASFLVFTVMAVQYNSLIDPLVIILTVPLALAGGILGLFITQTAIGATVVVGAVLLVGIVVNNAIILVELANQIHEQQGCDRATAMILAAPQRLRPILMTTVTTVLGLFPLALGLGEGSEFLQPMGIVVFSGLSLATGLTLFIIPCFYCLLHRAPLKPQPQPVIPWTEPDPATAQIRASR